MLTLINVNLMSNPQVAVATSFILVKNIYSLDFCVFVRDSKYYEVENLNRTLHLNLTSVI